MQDLALWVDALDGQVVAVVAVAGELAFGVGVGGQIAFDVVGVAFCGLVGMSDAG